MSVLLRTLPSFLPSFPGEEQFVAWRRSFETRPPPVSPYSPLYPGNDERYVKYVHNLPISWLQSALRSLEHGRLECHPALPQTESLRDCMERTIPFYKVVVDIRICSSVWGRVRRARSTGGDRRRPETTGGDRRRSEATGGDRISIRISSLNNSA